MDAQLSAELDDARQCLLDTYNLALAYGDDETRNPETYLQLMAELCEIKETAKRCGQALELAKEQHTLDGFERTYNKELNERKKHFNAKRTSEYKSFQQQLKQMANESDNRSGSTTANTSRLECDEFVMEGEINVYDPLTKQRMENPVRNTLCGHHYEKTSILEAIQINKRLRCPVAGCGNKQFVQQQHLQEDNAFKMRLSKMTQTQN